MRKADLKRVKLGFYVDDKGTMYFDIKEFLAVNNLADQPDIRAAIWQQVREEFGEVSVTELIESDGADDSGSGT